MYYARKAEPKGNKHLWEVEKNKQHEDHVERLRNMKASLDMSTPKSMLSSKGRNSKREQVMEERYAKIERENRILLGKMSEIMTKGSNLYKEQRPEGPRSLNYNTRKKEFDRIAADNQRILSRIQTVKPVLNKKEWKKDAARNDKLVESLSEYHQRSIFPPKKNSETLAAKAPGSPNRAASLQQQEQPPVYQTYQGQYHQALQTQDPSSFIANGNHLMTQPFAGPGGAFPYGYAPTAGFGSAFGYNSADGTQYGHPPWHQSAPQGAYNNVGYAAGGHSYGYSYAPAPPEGSNGSLPAITNNNFN